MGQREKMIKHLAIGLLMSRHMNDLAAELERLTDPKMQAYVKDNYRNVVIQRLNISLDLADKKKIGNFQHIDAIDEAMKLANEAYEKYIQARDIKRKEREEKRMQGEQQVVPG